MAALADEQTTPASTGRRLLWLTALVLGALLLGALAWWI